MTRTRSLPICAKHHGHHPDESCCDACGPLKDAIWAALNATAPAAYCAGCGRALHEEEVHCDDCWDDLIEDEQSQDGTGERP